MTAAEKLAMVKAILRIEDTSEDALITTYLTMAKQEIISWRYSNANPANVPEDVPTEYEITQVQSVINGYTQSGVEGQVLSIENGIHRHFEYGDMVSYIRSHVIPIAGVLRNANSSGNAGNHDDDGTASSDHDAGTSPDGEDNSISQDTPDSPIGDGDLESGEDG